MEEIIRLDGVGKQYRLGSINNKTLQKDIQSYFARKKGKDDPNKKIGSLSENKPFWALRNVSLSIYKGERVGIIGSNGAGKSTLLKILCRVTAPTEGDIDLYGRVASLLEIGTGFHAELTGRENIYLNGSILGMKKDEITDRLNDIIEFSEIGDFIDTPVKRYSSGMFVKLAFSVAAHLNSEILIMDEVLAVGDMAFQKKCLDKMRETAENDGKTILYVSHNMETIRNLCDRVIVINKGNIIYDGNVEDGIAVYLKQNLDDNPVEIDLTDKGRTDKIKAKFTHLSLKNKTVPSYEQGEKMLLNVTFDSTEKAEAYFKLGIDTQSGIRIASAITEKIQIETGINSKTFSVSLDNLEKGEFFGTISLIHSAESGTGLICSAVRCFKFNVDRAGAWSVAANGYFKLNITEE